MPPLGTPAFFYAASVAALVTMAVFQVTPRQPQTPPLRGSLSSGFNPRKKTRGFAPLPRRRFECGTLAFTSKVVLLDWVECIDLN